MAYFVHINLADISQELAIPLFLLPLVRYTSEAAVGTPHAHRGIEASMLHAQKQIPADWGAFVILKKSRRVAIMGGCAACGRKFFTPLPLFQVAVGAEDYLIGKFSQHHCHLASQHS